MNIITIIIYTIIVFSVGFATHKSFILSELRRSGKTNIGEFTVCVDDSNDNKKQITRDQAFMMIGHIKKRYPDINIDEITHVWETEEFVKPSLRIYNRIGKFER